MEARGGNGGVTVLASDAPSAYQIAPRSENLNLTTPAPASVHPPSTATMPAPATMPMKKKRGRPRKYAPDGSGAVTLSPRPISTAAPHQPMIDFTAEKRPKVKPASIGNWAACSVGANFIPHFINVNAGEDVTNKIISFSQQGPRAICILSANGVISSVTLRQPDSSGGTLTYEGRFEILSLSGSFMPSETGGARSRSGGMSVSLAGPDGRVVGGGVAGLLVAASPVQVVVGSFLAGNQHEQKQKKPKQDSFTVFTTAAPVPISSASPKNNFSSPLYHTDGWSSLPVEARNKPADINVSLPAG